MTDDSAPQTGAPEPPEATAEAAATDESDGGAQAEVNAQVASPEEATGTADQPAETADAEAGSAANSGRANRRKVREGLVLSIAMDKTAVVGVVDRVRHPRYAKTVQRTKRLYAHDESNDLRVGDRVRLAEVRPMSRLKRWRVVDVLERAK
jgi:small subunit ribosomal protein S17